MNVVKGLVGSKKFWVGFFGAVVWPFLIGFIPALEPLQEQSTEIVGVVVAYILGQGLADFGKHAG